MLLPNESLEPKVFGIGMFKTGTTSLKLAFQGLGFVTDGAYRPLLPTLSPLFDLDRNPFEHLMDDLEALSTQAQAFCDSPWLFLYKEMDVLYPNSKFILTLRHDPAALATSEINMWRSHLSHWWKRETGRDVNEAMFIDRYFKHNQQIRDYFSGREDLLEICIETEEKPWERICNFLGIDEIPNQDFPHVNKGDYS